jgi:hypothetical protein
MPSSTPFSIDQVYILSLIIPNISPGFTIDNGHFVRGETAAVMALLVQHLLSSQGPHYQGSAAGPLHNSVTLLPLPWKEYASQRALSDLPLMH